MAQATQKPNSTEFKVAYIDAHRGQPAKAVFTRHKGKLFDYDGAIPLGTPGLEQAIEHYKKNGTLPDSAPTHG